MVDSRHPDRNAEEHSFICARNELLERWCSRRITKDVEWAKASREREIRSCCERSRIEEKWDVRRSAAESRTELGECGRKPLEIRCGSLVCDIGVVRRVERAVGKPCEPPDNDVLDVGCCSRMARIGAGSKSDGDMR